jgi:hypothetical protein
MKPQPSSGVRFSPFVKSGLEDGHGREIKLRYQPGDILWVQETWKCIKYDSMDGDLTYGVEFKDGTRRYFEFDDNERFHQFGKFAFKNGWQSPYFMPREAARLFLTVRDVRVERLQDITEDDALKEGCLPGFFYGAVVISAKGKFHALWDSINGKKHPWESNPYVWVISFERRENHG